MDEEINSIEDEYIQNENLKVLWTGKLTEERPESIENNMVINFQTVDRNIPFSDSNSQLDSQKTHNLTKSDPVDENIEKKDVPVANIEELRQLLEFSSSVQELLGNQASLHSIPPPTASNLSSSSNSMVSSQISEPINPNSSEQDSTELVDLNSTKIVKITKTSIKNSVGSYSGASFGCSSDKQVSSVSNSIQELKNSMESEKYTKESITVAKAFNPWILAGGIPNFKSPQIALTYPTVVSDTTFPLSTPRDVISHSKKRSRSDLDEIYEDIDLIEDGGESLGHGKGKKARRMTVEDIKLAAEEEKKQSETLNKSILTAITSSSSSSSDCSSSRAGSRSNL